MRDYLEFFRQFRQRFKTTGSIMPSSRFLAWAMTGPLKRRKKPARILEVGPGTGAVTRRIVRLMNADDRLDLVEINEAFANLLRRRFETDRHYRRVSDQSAVHTCPLQNFVADEPYDFIISGLPLNNFPVELVEEIFDAFFRLLAPGGVLSYFEYMYVRSVRKRVGARGSRAKMCDLDRVLQKYLKRHRFRCSWVPLNVPPAWVQHLQHASDSTELATAAPLRSEQ